MGAFYGSIHVRTEDAKAVQNALEVIAKDSKCKFLMGPALNGWVSVFPENNGQDDQVSADMAKRLPNDLFHLMVHDDDIFAYFFYRDRQLVDQYNSNPDYFEEASTDEKDRCKGHPERFQNLLSKSESLNVLKSLLAADKEKYAFEQERMKEFVELVGLANALSSYEYLQDGERDEIEGWKQFIHIPDLAAEKAARKALQAQIKAEKKRLQNEGILLAEIKPPKEKGPGLPASISWGIDYTNNGLLLTLKSYHFTKTVDDPEYAAEIMTAQPPWSEPPQPLGLKTNWTAYMFAMSPSAKWLAGGFAAGDWKARVWDWQRKELSFEVPHSQAVQWVGFSKDEQFIYSLGGGEFIATSLVDKTQLITDRGLGDARKAAVHPLGKFAVVVFQQAVGIIDLEKKQLVKKFEVNQQMKSIAQLATFSEEKVISACIEALVTQPKLMEKLGVGVELQAALLKDAKAVDQLSSEARQALRSLIEKFNRPIYKTTESLFDVCFHPNGKQLFVAGKGMRVYDWDEALAMEKGAPVPELSVDSPEEDEKDPNSQAYTYSLCFDEERNLLLSCCLAGIVQYLNLGTGQSGTLLKPPEEMTIWRLALTSDRQALCCHCASRPKVRNLKNQFNCLQVWNYPALCKAAGLD